MTLRELLKKYPNGKEADIYLVYMDKFMERTIKRISGKEFFCEDYLDINYPELDEASFDFRITELQDDEEKSPFYVKELEIQFPIKKMTEDDLIQSLKESRETIKKGIRSTNEIIRVASVKGLDKPSAGLLGTLKELGIDNYFLKGFTKTSFVVVTIGNKDQFIEDFYHDISANIKRGKITSFQILFPSEEIEDDLFDQFKEILDNYSDSLLREWFALSEDDALPDAVQVWEEGNILEHIQNMFEQNKKECTLAMENFLYYEDANKAYSRALETNYHVVLAQVSCHPFASDSEGKRYDIIKQDCFEKFKEIMEEK